MLRVVESKSLVPDPEMIYMTVEVCLAVDIVKLSSCDKVLRLNFAKNLVGPVWPRKVPESGIY